MIRYKIFATKPVKFFIFTVLVNWLGQSTLADTVSDTVEMARKNRYEIVTEALENLRSRASITPAAISNRSVCDYATPGYAGRNVITLDKVRGHRWDLNPITVTRDSRYPTDEGSGLPTGAFPPYLPTDKNSLGERSLLLPFRMNYYKNMFVVRSEYSRPIIDSSAKYGFRILSLDQITENPKSLGKLYFKSMVGGTTPFSDSSFIKWVKWRTLNLRPTASDSGLFGRMGLPNLAFHLIDENIETMTLADSNVYKREVEGSWLVFDIEQSLPSIETAITSGFTVLENNGVAQAAYYSGYATSHVQPMRLAHSEFGWNTVSLFGREPSEKNWRIIGDLSKPMVDPLKWERYGRRIFEESAYLHANIYLTRWDPRNVASQLATLDANLGIIETSTVRPKHAMIPVLSTSFLSSGGECKNSTDPTWRWYTGLPISDEEARMTTASVFFSQVAGMGVWSSPSETPNGYLPGSMVPGRSFLIDVHTGSLPSPLLDSLGNPVALKKYDALFVRERMASNGKIQIRFEILPKNLENFTARQIQALNTCRDHNDISEVRQYTVDESALLPLLRAETKPIAAMFEGIALIQPIEPLLFFGVPENEVSARTLFGVYDGSLDPSTGKLNQGSPALPIVRHKVLRYYAPDTSGNHTILKKLHILLTYNPQLLYKDDYCSGQNENRCKILLPNFSGVEGRDVSLWADLTPRIYLLQE